MASTCAAINWEYNPPCSGEWSSHGNILLVTSENIHDYMICLTILGNLYDTTEEMNTSCGFPILALVLPAPF